MSDSLERRLHLSAQARAAQETRLAAGRIERELATVREYLRGDEPPPAAVLRRLAEEAVELVQHGAQWEALASSPVDRRVSPD